MTSTAQTYPLFRLLSYMKPFQRQYRLATFYSFMNKLFDIFPEILIGGAVDVVVNQKSSWIAKLMGLEDMSMQLLVLGVITFLAWGFESVFQYLYSAQPCSSRGASLTHGLLPAHPRREAARR